MGLALLTYQHVTAACTCVYTCLQDMKIYELIRGRRHYVAEDRVRSYMYQLMKALDHMHRNGIFHRYSSQEWCCTWDTV